MLMSIPLRARTGTWSSSEAANVFLSPPISNTAAPDPDSPSFSMGLKVAGAWPARHGWQHELSPRASTPQKADIRARISDSMEAVASGSSIFLARESRT